MSREDKCNDFWLLAFIFGILLGSIFSTHATNPFVIFITDVNF